MVSRSLIALSMHSPDATFPGDAPARKGSTDTSESRTDA